jgi:hypothetical protein
LNHELSTSRFTSQDSAASAQLITIKSDVADVLSRCGSLLAKPDTLVSPQPDVALIAQRLAGLEHLSMSAQEHWLKERLEHALQLTEALEARHGGR